MKSYYIVIALIFLIAIVNLIRDIRFSKETPNRNDPEEKGKKRGKGFSFSLSLVVLSVFLPVALEISNFTPARPIFLPFDGSVGLQDDFITITTEDGSDIYYSFDKDIDPKDGGQKYTAPIPRADWPDLPFVIGVRTKVRIFLWDKWLDEVVTLRFYAPEKGGGISEGKPADESVPEDTIIANSLVSQEWTPSYDELPVGFLSGWGDNGGGRESYTLDEINAGVLGNHIVFNSISDSVIGSEKNFVGARVDTGVNEGKDNVWAGNLIEVEEGETYLIRLFCHNNNPLGYDAEAENVEACFVIPAETGKTIAINGMLQCSNASPSEYWDSVVMTSKRPFYLEYVAGSACMENNAIGSNGGVTLDDRIADGYWTPLGYTALDGKIPGCFQYAAYVTIKVKPVFESLG